MGRSFVKKSDKLNKKTNYAEGCCDERESFLNLGRLLLSKGPLNTLIKEYL